MRERLHYFWVSLGVVYFVVACVSCSGSQQDDEELETDDQYLQQEEGDLGNDDAAEGNGQENFVEDSDQQSQQNQEYGNSDGINSETSDYANENIVNGSLNQGSGSGQYGNQTIADESDQTLIENVPAEPIANSTEPMANYVNTATTNTTAPPAMSAMSSDTAPIPGGRVRYVPEGGVQVFNAPDGSPVSSLQQGDHPITWEEGGWLRINNQMYVPNGSLSDAGIGRPHMSPSWQ